MTKSPQQKKKRPFLIELIVGFGETIREEFVDWFIEQPKGIAKAPLWKQLFQWPLYIAISGLIILIAGIAIIFLIAAIPTGS